MALKKSTTKMRLPEMGLNITSLIDVLTVLIFFLIRTMTVTSSAASPPEGLRLPASISEIQGEESTVVAISQKALRVNHDLVSKLSNGHFVGADLDSDGRTLKKLKELLQREHSKKERLFVSKNGGEFMPPSKILIQADKQMRFETLKHVLHTISVAGYTDYQFVIEPRSHHKK